MLNNFLVFDKNKQKGIDVDFIEENGKLKVVSIDVLKKGDV